MREASLLLCLLFVSGNIYSSLKLAQRHDAAKVLIAGGAVVAGDKRQKSSSNLPQEIPTEVEMLLESRTSQNTTQNNIRANFSVRGFVKPDSWLLTQPL